MTQQFKPQSVAVPKSLGGKPGDYMPVQSSYDRKLATACDVPRCTQSHETSCEYPGCTLKMCARHTCVVVQRVGEKITQKKMCPSHKRFVESGGGR